VPLWFRAAPAATSPFADVAAGMSRRNKRRLAGGGIAVGVVAALVALTLWFSGGGLPFVHSSSHSDASKPVLMQSYTDLLPYQFDLPYGMTKQQMIQRLGEPESVAGQCLQYPQNLVSWNGRKFTAVRMCFFGGQYQGWFLKIDGIWNTPGIYKAIEPPTTVTAVPLDKTIPDWSKRPHE
jgi:hypothetical protein